MNSPVTASANLRRVSDISLAAYLLARGHPLRDFKAGGRVEFVFADVPEQVVLAFYGGEDQVSARQILDALKNLKGLIVGVR
jgi:hypothetical protein